ncbi:MAG: ABC transporter permease [Gammaproteobacteria bacterium]|nr:ABC transporter permease [Gammaproteobacteria bacterium]
MPIAIREWRTSVLTKVFVGLGVGYPLLLSLILWLGVGMLLLIDAIGTVSDVPELEREIEKFLGANTPTRHTTYYVVDNSNTQFGDLIRDEVFRRDVASAVEFISSKDFVEFSVVRPLIDSFWSSDIRSSMERLKAKIQAEENTIDVEKVLVSRLFDTMKSLMRGVSEREVDRDARDFAYWWRANRHYLAQSIPEFSSHFFTEVTHEDWSLEELNDLLISEQLDGYFILPIGFPHASSSIQFVSTELTDSKERRSALLLRNWYESLATDVLTDQMTGLPATERANRTLPVIETGRVINEYDRDGTLVIKAGFEADLHPRYLNVWIRAIWTSLFLGAMFYSVYAMSFNLTEEKQNKVAEVLLSNMSPLNLMDGKVLGNVLVILTVFALWAVILGTPLTWMIALAPELGSQALLELFNPIYVLNWFVSLLLGLTLLGYFATALGALFATDRVLGLVITLLMFLLGSSLLTSVNPDSVIGSIVKFIPPFTPFALVSQTTFLPTLPVYLCLLALVIVFLWTIRFFLVPVFSRGMLLDAVPNKFSKLIKTLLTQD